MKIIKFIFFITIAIFASCSLELNDYDILDIDSAERNIDKSVVSANWVETEKQFSNSGLEMVGKRELSILSNELTLDDFFSGTTQCFPAYDESFSRFSLYSFDQLKDDTTHFHLKMDYLVSYVDSLLTASIPVHAYELTWKFHQVIFTTIALFDVYGELLYDNILFNVIQSERISTTGRSLLSRGEIPVYGGIESGNEVIHFYYNHDYCYVAEAWLWWEEFGHHVTEYTPSAQDSSQMVSNTYYVHDTVVYNKGYYIDDDHPNLMVINDFRNLSTADYGLYQYCLWIGPNKSDYIPNLQLEYSVLDPGMRKDLSQTIYEDDQSKFRRYNGCSTVGFVEMKIIIPPVN